MKTPTHIHFKGWSLFLDRDGVLNERYPGGYVQSWDMWKWLPGSLQSIVKLRTAFPRIFVVTNQQGIGKGLYSESDLLDIHSHMHAEVRARGAYFDGIYYCPRLAEHNPKCRKPNPGMALQAKKHFPEIEFDRAIMVGDSSSDVRFGRQLGMRTVFIHAENKSSGESEDLVCKSLADFTDRLPEIFGNWFTLQQADAK